MSKVQELKKGRVAPALDTPTDLSAEAVRALPKAIDLVARREKVILERACSAGFNSAAMREALRASGEIH